MKKDMLYDRRRPLNRLEKGDKAIITVSSPVGLRNNKEKYKSVPNGYYYAKVVDAFTLECPSQSLLSGCYCYWYGNKWGCSGIYADEVEGDEKRNDLYRAYS